MKSILTILRCEYEEISSTIDIVLTTYVLHYLFLLETCIVTIVTFVWLSWLSRMVVLAVLLHFSKGVWLMDMLVLEPVKSRLHTAQQNFMY